jgi:membrane protein YdbS with pleckstrin-like domain
MTTEKEIIPISEEEEREEKISKLFKVGKISILVMLTGMWIVSAVLGLISLWRGEGILDTPWVIMGIVLLFVVILLVIVPLFRSLRSDVRAFNKQKAASEESEMNETENVEEIEEINK